MSEQKSDILYVPSDCAVHGPILKKAEQERRISIQAKGESTKTTSATANIPPAGGGERRSSLTAAKRAELELWAQQQCPAPSSAPSLSPPSSRPLSPQVTWRKLLLHHFLSRPQ